MHVREIRLLSKLLFLLYPVGALGVFAYCKQWSRIKDETIKLKSSLAHLCPIITFKKHQTKPSMQTTLIKTPFTHLTVHRVIV